MRNLIIVLGDQLNVDSAAFDGFDKANDRVWMAEVVSEAQHVWSHKARIVLFLSAMRHFRDDLARTGINVSYRQLDDADNHGDIVGELSAVVRSLSPRRLVVVEPGEWRLREAIVDVAYAMQVKLEMRADRHFLCGHDEFAAHAAGRKQLRMEYFYRHMRRRLNILMDGTKPVGGNWNYDADNRAAFTKAGPGEIATPRAFRPSTVTKTVVTMVEARFSQHPGKLQHFDWPVTPSQARAALSDFVMHRLDRFGQYQDAMWSNTPYLFHSRLAAAMNLKLLDPRDAIDQAENAFRNKQMPLNAVEGFVRQIIGWREYVRGVYWRYMPNYLEMNYLEASLPLPEFYWTGETDMACLRDAIGQSLNYGYAHHIQRLMVTGLYAMLLGVEPKQVHEWYLAIYVDAVEWVELPNTIGMSQYADGGVMGSKPYAASGKYIHRMGNYCAGCRFDPSKSTGPTACPFTTLYWDFLMRNERRLNGNARMSLQLKNVARKSNAEQRKIQVQAAALRYG